MPTYQYECRGCGRVFEHWQSIADRPLTTCAECGSDIHRVVSGGTGFFLKSRENAVNRFSAGECSFERTGRTCRGGKERCSTPGCGDAK